MRSVAKVMAAGLIGLGAAVWTVEPAGAQSVVRRLGQDLGLVPPDKPARKAPRRPRAAPRPTVAAPASPAPQAKPETRTQAAIPGAPRPKPDETPDRPPEPAGLPAAPQAKPAQAPPQPEAGQSPAAPEGGKEPDATRPVPPPPPPPPEPIVLTDGEAQACLARLAALGVEAKPLPPIEADNGCSVPAPLEVRSVGAGIALAPPAVTVCPMAEALALWARDVAAESEAAFETRPKSLSIGTSYQCRPRNGRSGAKLSEHGIANGVDIAGIRLESGPAFDVARVADEDDGPTARFARAVRARACVHFTTVLGPGTDPSHETHLHLDLARRRNGYRICQ
ncbi:extensin-like domain-containing protein [Prosthecomicrobium sp. N25]|uniref:extensin-like domain-containing protein n=1 Tax=Prosthecomicrobium sp. N25 TaxID=3129254 RepID=UPI0030777A29